MPVDRRKFQSRCRALVALAGSLVIGCGAALAQSPATQTSHGFTLFGELHYGADFEHFNYASPDAIKGGEFRYAFASSFDNLNPFIVAGTPPLNIEDLVFDRLMRRSGDEAVSVYGVIAESVTWPDDYAWAEFELRESARFHDGSPITADDVAFTIDVFKTQGSPQYRADYGMVASVDALGPKRVRITFADAGDRGNVYTVAQLPVLPRGHWTDRDFSEATVEPLAGSGPYRIVRVDQGRSITYERVPDYWAADLPVNVGLYNFDVILHDYFRDITVEQEALLAGQYDLRWETLPAQWVNGYDIPAVEDGRLIKEMLPYSSTTLYSAYFFNTRDPRFADRRVREAIAQAYDFEWLNRMIFYDQYVRMSSHFENSELSAEGLPSPAELELLEPWRDQLPEEVFTRAYEPPTTDGSRASLRENLRYAVRLLESAGWTINDGRLENERGEQMSFEVIGWDPFFQRVNAPFIANLELLGIDARQRIIDTAQWFNRLQNFDFDVTIAFYWPLSLSPGAELRNYWESTTANQPGASNYAGIENPVVDALIEDVVKAPDRTAKVAAARALDRVLLWNYYSVPNYYAPAIPIVYWDKFGRPEQDPTWLRFLWHMTNWWIDPQKEARLNAGRGDSD